MLFGTALGSLRWQLENCDDFLKNKKIWRLKTTFQTTLFHVAFPSLFFQTVATAPNTYVKKHSASKFNPSTLINLLKKLMGGTIAMWNKEL